MSISLAALILVFGAIAIRQLIRFPLKIWQILGIGALLALVSKEISVASAWEAIDWRLLFFLFGMFVVGEALEQSGSLARFASRHLKECSPRKLAAAIVFGMGLLSAILMNDTLAILGVPLLLQAAKQRQIATHPLLLTLAFAITTGSALSPIGNPQNLLIALQTPLDNPFWIFLRYLAAPTLINLFLLYFLSLFLFKKTRIKKQIHSELPSYDRRLAFLSQIALGAVFLLALANLIFPSFPMPWIALAPACLLLIGSSKRGQLLKQLDWGTLLFFAALFILMQSVWDNSSLKDAVSRFPISIAAVLTVSLLASQIISNVPMAALYLPLLHASDPALSMALAAGTTLAGNLLIFGAASNLIILQNAEKRGDRGISFFEFAKFGIPLTLIQIFICWIFLK